MSLSNNNNNNNDNDNSSSDDESVGARAMDVLVGVTPEDSLYEIAVDFEAPKTSTIPPAVMKDLLDVNCEFSAVARLYQSDRMFVAQLLKDEWLKELLADLRNPRMYEEYEYFPELPPETKSGILTIVRAYHMRTQHIIALVEYVHKVYPFIESGVARNRASKLVLEELDVVVKIIPHGEMFAAFKATVNRRKENFEVFLRSGEIRPDPLAGNKRAHPN